MLKFYILEHVTGSLKRRGLEDESYATRKQHALREALPHFKHHLWVINSIDHGLPQDRRRIFFVGVHSACMQALGKSELDDPQTVLRSHQCSLADILSDHESMPDIMSTRTEKQVHNIKAYNELLQTKMTVEPYVKVACCDHSRNPSGRFGSFFHIDVTGTITTSDPGKWVMGQVPGKVWGYGRSLSMSERARAQGIMPCSLSAVHNPRVLNKLIGNSIPVNSVGAVIAAVCPALVAFESCIQSQVVRQMPPAQSESDALADDLIAEQTRYEEVD
jgi:site-specific DNA-cytosine methylase